MHMLSQLLAGACASLVRPLCRDTAASQAWWRAATLMLRQARERGW
jgi:hypothetical protein